MRLEKICSTIATNCFKVGDTIECMRDHHLNSICPAKAGESFQIKDIKNCRGYKYIQLLENNAFGDVGFWANYFRKVEE